MTSESQKTWGWRIAVDIGGTFVDAVACDGLTGNVTISKAPTAADPTTSVIEAIKALGIGLDQASGFVHGTTLALNAILERRGALTGIITNEGFGDILEIGRGDVPVKNMYDFQYVRPPSLVRRRNIVGVKGRLDYRGEILEELDSAQVIDAGAFLVNEQKVESLAVVFLHSYANPVHERTVGKLLEASFPGTWISISCNIAREYREYERTSTTVLDAYIRPVLNRYLDVLESELTAKGLAHPCLIMRSAGGAMTVQSAKISPLLTVLSGPAGGVTGASYLGGVLERRNIISFDAGGTSVDACVIVDGAPAEVFEANIEGLPMMIPVFDIRTIGAGGGSIAWMERGLLKVGPRSAGANPGPIAYGRGGLEPTVTDAALCLGYLEPDDFLVSGESFLGGDARKGVLERIADPLGMSLDRAAAAIFQVTLAKQVGALREITVEKGLDPREFAMLAFGGMGPILGPMLARELDIAEVIVPFAPAAFSAWGMLMADLEFEVGRTVLLPLDTHGVDTLENVFEELETAAIDSLNKEGVAPSDRRLVRKLDLRYRGQEHTLSVSVSDISEPDEIRSRFDDYHFRRHRHRMPEPVEIVCARVHATGETQKPKFSAPAVASKIDLTELPIRRQAYDFATQETREFEVCDRDQLRPGSQIFGPAVVRETTCVTVMHSDQRLFVDEFGNLIIRRYDDVVTST